MSGHDLLSDLCTICYTEKPKYRCPRCRTQTCSLPCYKKHQQRASCSGKRDPAAYLKKNQLATPSGLDQDFNYLKSIEGHIDHASQATLVRTSGDGHGKFRNVTTGWRADSRLQTYLAQNRITIERAPKGLQRQRENNTRSTKSQRVLWTVEWVAENGEHEVQQDCSATSPLSSLFAISKLGKATAQRLGASQETSDQKRKRKRQEIVISPTGPVASESASAQSEDLLSGHAPEAEENATASNARDITSNKTGLSSGTASELVEPSSGTETPAPRYYYLLRPATAAASKVLIPLDATATLTGSLRGQMVQEYPTILVLPRSSETLPTGFVFYKDYVRTRKVEDAEPNRLQRSAGSQTGGQREANDSTSLDAQSILSMLKRDMRA